MSSENENSEVMSNHSDDLVDQNEGGVSEEKVEEKEAAKVDLEARQKLSDFYVQDFIKFTDVTPPWMIRDDLIYLKNSDGDVFYICDRKMVFWESEMTHKRLWCYRDLVIMEHGLDQIILRKPFFDNYASVVSVKKK